MVYIVGRGSSKRLQTRRILFVPRQLSCVCVWLDYIKDLAIRHIFAVSVNFRQTADGFDLKPIGYINHNTPGLDSLLTTLRWIASVCCRIKNADLIEVKFLLSPSRHYKHLVMIHWNSVHTHTTPDFTISTTTQFYVYPVMSNIQNSLNTCPNIWRHFTCRTQHFANLITIWHRDVTAVVLDNVWS